MNNICIAVFASGAGSNAKALIEYFSSNDCIHVECLVSNKESCGAITMAQDQKVDSKVFENDCFETGQEVADYLTQKNIDFIVLAGFLRKLPHFIIQNYPDRIINIHPSILPEFGGKGMYGKHVHKAVLAAAKKHSGITIHLVNENYDEGNYIAQFYTTIANGETITSLESKIQHLEHRYFPYVVEGYIKSQI